MPFSGVEVNGEVISQAEIRAEMAALRQEAEQDGTTLSPDERMQLRDAAIARLVEHKLVFQEVRRLNLMPSQKEIQDAAAAMAPRGDGVTGCRAGTDLEAVERAALESLVGQRVIAYWCRNVKPPGGGEIRDYYRQHRDDFWTPESIRASHIVKHFENTNADEIRDAMAQVRERLLSGEDFAAVAAASSDCPENGGDLGFFARGVMVPEFDAAVFDAPLHEVTPVFETQFGLHIAVVYERRPAGIREFQEVAAETGQALLRLKQDREVGRRLAALREKAVIREAES